MINLINLMENYMHPITFTTLTDLVFDYNGVYTVASGTAPHNPSQARVVFRNAETTRITAEEEKQCQELADVSEAALEAWVIENFSFGPRVAIAR